MAGTVAQFIAQLEARLGHPYSETIDGGVGPEYFDCSGLVMVCLDAIGINFTRTTYSQWADARYVHKPPSAVPQPGWIVYMHVAGEQDPGHVGVYLGGGQFINAPHTGAFVRIETISNSPSEHVFGYIVPPYGSPAPPIPPIPPLPIPVKEESVQAQFNEKDGLLYVEAASSGSQASAEDNLLVFQIDVTQDPPKIKNVVDMTNEIATMFGGARYAVQP